jgi:hypothetical protein
LCESGDDELHRLVKESFTTENFGVKVTQTSIRSREDVRAEAILKETTKRIDHRYETGLLWKSSNFILPESKRMAFMRLKCTERRMDKDAAFAQQYNLKIAEYLTKGYVRKLSPEEAAVTTTRTFYLPHFGVTSPNKPGKFRLVFDAAAKAMGYSLNDFIVSGPDLLQPLPEVLHKFREGRIAFTGDIADMFHRVAVREEDQYSQRFLWRGTERQESVWRQWIAELQYITIVQIPRCYDVDYNKSEVQLHVFVDASEAAFSAVCYFRISRGDRVTTALVAAKSKVAPLKQLSIPRLELQGALLGTRLAASLTRGHRRTISRTVFWSDSKTVLCWLRSDKGRFKQFVSFRVGEILESTDPSQWRWVPSKENVADEATCEDKRAEFNPNCRWMTGPDFLKAPKEDWPQEDRQQTDEGVGEDDLEFRPVHHQQLR